MLRQRLAQPREPPPVDDDVVVEECQEFARGELQREVPGKVQTWLGLIGIAYAEAPGNRSGALIRRGVVDHQDLDIGRDRLAQYILLKSLYALSELVGPVPGADCDGEGRQTVERRVRQRLLPQGGSKQPVAGMQGDPRHQVVDRNEVSRRMILHPKGDRARRAADQEGDSGGGSWYPNCLERS